MISHLQSVIYNALASFAEKLQQMKPKQF